MHYLRIVVHTINGDRLYGVLYRDSREALAQALSDLQLDEHILLANTFKPNEVIIIDRSRVDYITAQPFGYNGDDWQPISIRELTGATK